MPNFAYCLGHVLDGNYSERTCKHRENCRYYIEDLFVKYRGQLDDAEMLICFEPCPYYLPKREEQKCELSPDKDIFKV
jgi:hypothetical protein